MEKARLPNLKNKNFLETQIRRFTKINTIIDNLEEDNYNKFKQVDVIKKTNFLEEKTKKYSNNNYRLFSVKHYLHKKKSSVVRKFENELIKKKLKLNQTSKLIDNDLKSLNYGLTSPLNDKYKVLISNIDYNRRCFRNLDNKEFDCIFKDKANLSQEPIESRKRLIPKSTMTRNRNNNLNKKIQKFNTVFRNNDNIYRLSTATNYFENKIKNKRKNKFKITNNYSKNRTNNISNTIYGNYQNTSSKSINKKFNKDYFNKDGKYKKFIILLKKQYDKNTKLLNEVKKQEKMSRDILLVSLAKLNRYKYKKF